MSLKRTSKHGHSTMSELNITPLLDLVFVLLVIFIITTPQMVNSLEMTLPSNKPKPPDNQPKPKINLIEVDNTGQAFLNKTAVSVDELKASLGRLKSNDSDLTVVVNGSDVVDYQKMVNVLDVLHQLDITKIGLQTQ